MTVVYSLAIQYLYESNSNIMEIHRRIYYKHHDLEPNPKCDIHHIDKNHYNNDINNLIEMPRQLHNALHNYIGLLPRKNIVVLLKWFNTRVKNKFSKVWLEHNIKKQVNKFKLSKAVLKRNKDLLDKKEEKYQKYITGLWQSDKYMTSTI